MSDSSGQTHRSSPVDGDDFDEAEQRRCNLRQKLQDIAHLRLQPEWLVFPKNRGVTKGGFASVVFAILEPPREDDGTGSPRSRTISPVGTDDMQDYMAVKKLTIKAEDDKDKILRLFVSETRIMAKLAHPNVVQLKGFVEDADNDIFWMVLPWQANGNLREFVLSEESQWEVPELLSLIKDTISGIEYLHSEGICHGDLKAQNILVSSECRGMITDFGSARVLKKGSEKVSPHAGVDPTVDANNEDNSLSVELNAETGQLTIIGYQFSLRWVAPEILFEDQPELASDIWAFGWICWEVLTGKLPFEDLQNRNAVIVSIYDNIMPTLEDEAQIKQIRQLVYLMSSCWKYAYNERLTAEQCRVYIGDKLGHVMIPRSKGSKVRSPDLLLQLAWLSYDHGDQGAAKDYFDQAWSLSLRLRDTGLTGGALIGLGITNLQQGNPLAAAQHLEKAYEMCFEDSQIYLRNVILTLLGEAFLSQGEISGAEIIFSQVHAYFSTNGDHRDISRALIGLGQAHFIKSNDSAAQAVLLQALNLCREEDNGPNQGEAVVLQRLAELSTKQSNFDSAELLYRQSAGIYEKLGTPSGKATGLLCLGDIQRRRRRYEEALSAYEEAREIFNHLGERSNECEALIKLGRVYQEQGRYGPAMTLFSEARTQSCEIGSRLNAAKAFYFMAEVDAAEERYEVAQDRLEEARAAYREMELTAEFALCHAGLVRVKERILATLEEKGV